MGRSRTRLLGGGGGGGGRAQAAGGDRGINAARKPGRPRWCRLVAGRQAARILEAGLGLGLRRWEQGCKNSDRGCSARAAEAKDWLGRKDDARMPRCRCRCRHRLGSACNLQLQTGGLQFKPCLVAYNCACTTLTTCCVARNRWPSSHPANPSSHQLRLPPAACRHLPSAIKH